MRLFSQLPTKYANFPALTALFALTVSACASLPQTQSLQTAPVEASSLSTESSAMTLTSTSDFASTNARLQAALDARGLTLFATIDHAAGAAKVDQTLAPNKVYVFGNPKAGTPLMLADPGMGLDLPLKALIYEHSGEVFVSVTDIRALTAARGITEPAQLITNIETALAGIAAEAAGS